MNILFKSVLSFFLGKYPVIPGKLLDHRSFYFFKFF